MENLVLSSIPLEELKNVISDTVRCELSKHLEVKSQSPKTAELLTRKEAAQLLGISLPTLLDYTKSGKITGYRLGTRVRYKREELEQSLMQIRSAKQKGGLYDRK
ncbi:helix-turn-helix domain-containing protein [Chitinophaga oryzae]|uniref:Helix-turn-helix domain-containing protein n=1 Tax=Chitinophaga oryzae TaxID=2725414 RepID=A0ABX6LNQ7_9BACT|nr:helix-turn-helix domain-containing protein [Chitinophaga oryzae]QJB41725.1 helix-turn-helix domain-containing protein [Chitinophaga oryzae]